MCLGDCSAELPAVQFCPRNSSFKPGSSWFCTPIGTSHLTTYSRLPEFLPWLKFPALPILAVLSRLPCHFWAYPPSQLQAGSATTAGSADTLCGSRAHPAHACQPQSPSHFSFALPWSQQLFHLVRLHLTKLWISPAWTHGYLKLVLSTQGSTNNAEPTSHPNLPRWPLDLQGDSTWWINTAVVSTMQMIFYLIPPFHGSLLPWINTPEAPSLVSRACLGLQAQAGSQAHTAWAERSFLNPGIYRGKNVQGRQVTGHHFQSQQFV